VLEIFFPGEDVVNCVIAIRGFLHLCYVVRPCCAVIF